MITRITKLLKVNTSRSYIHPFPSETLIFLDWCFKTSTVGTLYKLLPLHSFEVPAMYANQVYPSNNGQPNQTAVVSPDVQSWFRAVDKDNSGKISWEELQSALVNGQGEKFSAIACKLMISMFDMEKTGSIRLNEFGLLYNYINQWLGVFRNYDRDQSGSIEEGELAQAFQQMGFRFSPEFIKFLIDKNDLKNHRMISVDQFIVICIQIQRFTEAFRARDSEMKGEITLGFEDFLSIALNCSP